MGLVVAVRKVQSEKMDRRPLEGLSYRARWPPGEMDRVGWGLLCKEVMCSDPHWSSPTAGETGRKEPRWKPQVVVDSAIELQMCRI